MTARDTEGHRVSIVCRFNKAEKTSWNISKSYLSVTFSDTNIGLLKNHMIAFLETSFGRCCCSMALMASY